MLTFYDVVECDDIDINNGAAKFYLIQIDKSPDHQRYKVCATTQDLRSPQMKFDPKTRIEEYWLITCEQLKHANLSILFPNDKLRDEPLAITDLDTAFNYDSTIPVEQNRAFHFDPTIPPEKFGPKPIKQSRNSINPAAGYPSGLAIAGYHFGIAAAGDLGLAHTQQARAVERGPGIHLVPIGPNVQRLINLNFITAAHYRAMSHVERYNIVSTHELIASGLITIDEARLLSNKEMKILKNPSVCSLLLQHQMTVAQAKVLTPEQINRIEDGHADPHGDPADGFRMG